MSEYVYVAQYGGRDYEEFAGIYTDFEAAWEAAIAAGPTTARVWRFTLDATAGGELLRWHDWSHVEGKVVVVTPETADALFQADYAAARRSA